MSIYGNISTGDARYRQPHGIRAVSTQGEEHTTDTMQLAELCARAMDGNASGGMCCEPGLVFFQCNNHPCVSFRLLEGMKLGDFLYII